MTAILGSPKRLHVCLEVINASLIIGFRGHVLLHRAHMGYGVIYCRFFLQLMVEGGRV